MLVQSEMKKIILVKSSLREVMNPNVIIHPLIFV